MKQHPAPTRKPSTTTQTTSNRSEIIKLQDLLPNLIPNAQIGFHSYEFNGQQNVKTNLRKCQEQFFNILYQNRVDDTVDRVVLNIILPITDKQN